MHSIPLLLMRPDKVAVLFVPSDRGGTGRQDDDVELIT